MFSKIPASTTPVVFHVPVSLKNGVVFAAATVPPVTSNCPGAPAVPVPPALPRVNTTLPPRPVVLPEVAAPPVPVVTRKSDPAPPVPDVEPPAPPAAPAIVYVPAAPPAPVAAPCVRGRPTESTTSTERYVKRSTSSAVTRRGATSRSSPGDQGNWSAGQPVD